MLHHGLVEQVGDELCLAIQLCLAGGVLARAPKRTFYPERLDLPVEGEEVLYFRDL